MSVNASLAWPAAATLLATVAGCTTSTNREATLREAEAARRVLEENSRRLLPVLKHKALVSAMDLGAIGPKRLVEKKRPWRQEVVPGLYAFLALPEAPEGAEAYGGERLITNVEMAASAAPASHWLEQAVQNLEAPLFGARREHRDPQGRLVLVELGGFEPAKAAAATSRTATAALARNASALVLSRKLRADMLERFAADEVGAIVTTREALVFFRSDDPFTRRPIVARAHGDFDAQKRAVFRGVLSITKNGIGILEPP